MVTMDVVGIASLTVRHRRVTLPVIVGNRQACQAYDIDCCRLRVWIACFLEQTNHLLSLPWAKFFLRLDDLLVVFSTRTETLQCPTDELDGGYCWFECSKNAWNSHPWWNNETYQSHRCDITWNCCWSMCWMQQLPLLYTAATLSQKGGLSTCMTSCAAAANEMLRTI